MEIGPNNGDKVKVLFSNGMVESGTVVYWSDQKAVLTDGHNKLIINNTLQNIIAIQVIAPPPKPNEVFVEEKRPEEYFSRENLRALKLAELHKLRAEEERTKARALVRSFESSGEIKTPYALNRTTIPGKWNQSIQFDPSKENIRSY